MYQALPDIKLKIEGIKDSVEGIKEEGNGELEVKEESKKDEKLGKKKVSKKGRIHEVRYMDVGVDEDEFDSDDGEDVNGSEKSEHDDLGGAKFVEKKRKKGGSENGRILSELNGEKQAKSIGKVGKGSGNDDNDDNETGKSESDDLATAKIVGKKKKKGDSKEGQVLSKKNGEKRTEKMSMVDKRDGEEQKKDGLALKGVEESGGQKGKKKYNLGSMLKNAETSMKVRRGKKKQPAE